MHPILISLLYKLKKNISMKTAELPVIELSGLPRERGRLYGEAAKPLIAATIESWRADLGNFAQNSAAANNIDSDVYLNEFFSKTNYISAIQQWTPDLLEEVEGIAEGSGQRLENILGLQLMDEEWVFGLCRDLNKPMTKCTAFGLPDHAFGVNYAGQNMDVPCWVEGKQVLLRVMPTETSPEALIFSMAGSLGLNGLNANGLGVTCNTLTQLNYAIDGLPVLFIVRSILEKQSIDQAEQFLRSIPHASGQNYILSAPGDIRCFECCGTSVARYAPDTYQGRVFHTNHPLVNQDGSDVLPPEKRRSTNTVARLDSIFHRLGDSIDPITLDDIKAALASHDDPVNPVSRRINLDNIGSSIGYTAGASIYELGVTPRLHLAAGPPCETAFEVFEFNVQV